MLVAFELLLDPNVVIGGDPGDQAAPGNIPNKVVITGAAQNRRVLQPIDGPESLVGKRQPLGRVEQRNALAHAIEGVGKLGAGVFGLHLGVGDAFLRPGRRPHDRTDDNENSRDHEQNDNCKPAADEDQQAKVCGCVFVCNLVDKSRQGTIQNLRIT